LAWAFAARRLREHAVSLASTRATAAGLTTFTVMWLVALLSMLQPLATDLYLPTLPALAAALSADVAQVQWTLSAFVAAFGLWQLAAGPLSDRFGRRPVILAGLACYFAGSLICAAAPGLPMLIAGRVLQAIGACSALVGIRGLVRDLYAPREGAQLIASAAGIMSIAPLAGPVLGAYAVEAFGWRAAFVLLAAFSLALLVLLPLRLRESNQQRNLQALAPGPMLRTYVAIVRVPAFRAYTLAAAGSYATLFAFLSGGSFVLIRVLGLAPIDSAWAYALMVTGYLVGTRLCRRSVASAGIQRTVQRGALVQAASCLTMAALTLAGVIHWAAIVLPMFAFGLSHGLVQPPAQSAAVAPFPRSAGAAAALMGFLMMAAATAVGAWMGARFDGTVRPLTFSMAALSLVTLTAAYWLVRRDGDVSGHH
jgi:MFS transporter, DHA1 family, multidrug resistance protein